ncbi:MAG: EAL domain-containing protein [Acidobacteria bacterium]|nr:EAL domain-containing protein [Acidobacteriota bacterium]
MLAAYAVGLLALSAPALVQYSILAAVAALTAGWIFWKSHDLSDSVFGALQANAVLALFLTDYHLDATAATGLICLAAATFGVSSPWMLALSSTAVAGWLIRPPLSAEAPHAAILWLGPGITLAALGVHWVIAVKWQRLDLERRQLTEEVSRLQAELEDTHQARLLRASEATRVLEKRGETEGLWDWDLRQDRMAFSPRWAKMLGYAHEEIGDSPESWFNLIHPHDLGRTLDRLTDHLEGREPTFEAEHRIRSRDGGYCWVLNRGQALFGEGGKPERILGSQMHLGRLKSFESKLLHDATHDKLTGLPNRHYLLARLREEISRCHRNPNYGFAVMFMDLDGFKDINDSLGHIAGDRMLSLVGRRLSDAKRPEDTVARMGGDEFVVIVRNVLDEAEALVHAGRIQEVLGQPFQVGEQELVTGTSIGIALSASNLHRAEDLLRNADIAMYHAKSTHKGQIQLFDEEMHVRTRRLWSLQNDLRGAIERDELKLLYQPFISLDNNRICGAEALIRWERSDGELVSPSEFIPLAEEQGLIGAIGEWALRRACEQNKAWQDEGLRPIKISVNLSTKQLSNHEFASTVRRTLTESGLDPRWLQLELTESALMGSLDATPASLYSLFCMDIQLAIDDFGTGYSSLGYLRRLKFDTLKIDKSFVEDIASDRRAAALARSIISMAHSLRMTSLAEGVETPEQLELLRAYGCGTIQGYLASRPLTAEALAALLRDDVNLLADYEASERPSKRGSSATNEQDLVRRFADLEREAFEEGARQPML